MFASVHAKVQRDRRSSMGRTADEATQYVHQRPRLDGPKFTGVEELAVAHRTRFVPHGAGSPIEDTNHRRVAAWTIDAALLVAARRGGRARRIQEIDACFVVKIVLFERIDPQPLARAAPIDLRLLDLHRLHRRVALGTLELHGVPSRRGSRYEDDRRRKTRNGRIASVR